MTDKTVITYGYTEDGQVNRRDQWFTDSGAEVHSVTQTFGHSGNLLSREVSIPNHKSVKYDTYYDSVGRIVRINDANDVIWEAVSVDGTSAFDPQDRPYHVNEDGGFIVKDRAYSKVTGQLLSHVIHKKENANGQPQLLYGMTSVHYAGSKLIGYQDAVSGNTWTLDYDRDGRLIVASSQDKNRIVHQEKFSHFLDKTFNADVRSSRSLWNMEHAAIMDDANGSVDQMYQFGDGINASPDTLLSMINRKGQASTTFKVNYAEGDDRGLVRGVDNQFNAEYDNAGRLVRIADKFGITEELFYDALGDLIERRITKEGKTSFIFYVGPYATVIKGDQSYNVSPGVHVLLGQTRLATVPVLLNALPFSYNSIRFTPEFQRALHEALQNLPSEQRRKLEDVSQNTGEPQKAPEKAVGSPVPPTLYPLFYHRDHRGSVVATTRSRGPNSLSSTFRYDTYGALEKSPGETLAQPEPELGYIGGRTLTGGALYLNARVYHPFLRRFLQPDSIDLLRYTYVAGDPINRVDPSGHIWGMPERDIKVAQEVASRCFCGGTQTSNDPSPLKEWATPTLTNTGDMIFGPPSPTDDFQPNWSGISAGFGASLGSPGTSTLNSLASSEVQLKLDPIVGLVNSHAEMGYFFDPAIVGPLTSVGTWAAAAVVGYYVKPLQIAVKTVGPLGNFLVTAGGVKLLEHALNGSVTDWVNRANLNMTSPAQLNYERTYDRMFGDMIIPYFQPVLVR